MAINKRNLKVTFTFENDKSIVLDQSINLKVRIEKNVLALQNKAEIEIVNLGYDQRSYLLSNFSAWDKRLSDTGAKNLKWVGVKIEAGYGKESSLVYVGEVVLCSLTASPPNASVRVSCFTRQVDKTKFITGRSPNNVTFREYVEWAARQMGFESGNVDFESSHADNKISNPARSIYTAAALMWDIQDQYKPEVVAFIDDENLIVRDRNKAIKTSEIATISDFVGIPTWNEWGVSFKCLMNPSVKLARGVKLKSILNPDINDTYVITGIKYELASRDTNFYVSAQCSPAAE